MLLFETKRERETKLIFGYWETCVLLHNLHLLIRFFNPKIKTIKNNSNISVKMLKLISQLTCSYCSKIWKDPILLPCDEVICREYLAEREVVKENRIKCNKCKLVYKKNWVSTVVTRADRVDSEIRNKMGSLNTGRPRIWYQVLPVFFLFFFRW
jgi:hypothetical protein